MRSSKPWRARLAVAATVSALVAGGLVFGGGTPANALVQGNQSNPVNNYAGPKTCAQAQTAFGVPFQNCTNTTTGIEQYSAGGLNVFEATGGGGSVTQSNSTGANRSICNISSTASGSQGCAITQQNSSGQNLVEAALTALVNSGTTALTNISQTNSQLLAVDQTNISGGNVIKGPGAPDAALSIGQTANSAVKVPVVHTQQTNQLVAAAQRNTNGMNAASFKLDRNQSSTATGSSSGFGKPAITQAQDPTVPGTSPACGSEPLANGSVCVLQDVNGPGGSFLKVRANDKKVENGQALTVNGPWDQRQGSNTGNGGWLIRPRVPSAGGAGSTVDIGQLPVLNSPGVPGAAKDWSITSKGPFGFAGNGPRVQNDGIRLPIIGLSPDNVTSYEKTNLTGPDGTVQSAHLTAIGHADFLWKGLIEANLTAGSSQLNPPPVTFQGQNINASQDCTQNTPNECSNVDGSPSNVEGTEGAPMDGVTVGTFSASSDQVPASQFSASIDWGDGTAPTNGDIQQIGETQGSFEVTGSHTYAEEGTFPITVTIRNGDTVAGVIHSTASVADAALHASGSNLSNQGLSISGVTATFTDDNPAGDLSDFSATINWGDGSSSPGTVAGPTEGAYSVSGSHTYAGAGNFTVTTTINDVGGSTASAQSTAHAGTASATGVNFSATEYAAFSGPVATIHDNNGDDTASAFSASIDWGDGSTSAGTITGSNGSFTVSGTHTYNEDGHYTVKTTVKNAQTNAVIGTATSTATVADAPFTLTGRTISQTSRSFYGILATGTDYERGITATIKWGDGSVTQVAGGSGIDSDGHGGFSVSAAHTYARQGTKTITITAHEGSHSATATTTLQIGNPT